MKIIIVGLSLSEIGIHAAFFQLVKMLMVVVTVYTLCYFPLNIVWVSLYLIIFLNSQIKLFQKFPQLILEASGFLTASSEAGYR